MAVTAAQIKAEFPEFVRTDPALLTAKINDAIALLHQSTLGDDYDQGVKYMACHLLTLSPSGEFARLKTPDKDGATSTYERSFKTILRKVAGAMVI